MSFFKEIRRRSRASFRTNVESSDFPSANDEMPSSKSSSTPDSSSHSYRNTPASFISRNTSSCYLPIMPKLNGGLTQGSPSPQRPVPISAQSSRNNTPVRHPHKCSALISAACNVSRPILILMYCFIPGWQLSRDQWGGKNPYGHLALCPKDTFDLGQFMGNIWFLVHMASGETTHTLLGPPKIVADLRPDW